MGEFLSFVPNPFFCFLTYRKLRVWGFGQGGGKGLGEEGGSKGRG